MFCKHCGNELGEGAKFCPKCGNVVVAKIETKSKPQKSVVSSIVGVVAFVLAFAGVRYLMSNGGTTNQELIQQSVSQIKSSTQLPQKVDDITTLTDISAQPNAIRYIYVISGADTSALSNASLKSHLVTGVCQNSDTKNILDRNINMEYSYSVQNSPETYFVSISKSDCQ